MRAERFAIQNERRDTRETSQAQSCDPLVSQSTTSDLRHASVDLYRAYPVPPSFNLLYDHQSYWLQLASCPFANILRAGSPPVACPSAFSDSLLPHTGSAQCAITYQRAPGPS